MSDKPSVRRSKTVKAKIDSIREHSEKLAQRLKILEMEGPSNELTMVSNRLCENDKELHRLIKRIGI